MLPAPGLIYLPVSNLSGLSVCVRYYRLLPENAAPAHRWEKPRFQIPVHINPFGGQPVAP